MNQPKRALPDGLDPTLLEKVRVAAALPSRPPRETPPPEPIAAGKPNVDPLDDWIDGVERWASQMADAADQDATLECLPEPSVEQEQRMVWELQSSTDQPWKLVPRWQRRSIKSGTYSKGKPVPLDQIRRDPKLPLDPVDHRVVSEIVREFDDDRVAGDDQARCRLPIVRALTHLVGAKHVWLDGVSVSVRSGMLPLRIQDSADGELVTRPLADSGQPIETAGDEQSIETKFLPDGMVFVDRDHHQLHVAPNDDGSMRSQIVEDLISGPPIPADRREKYLDAVRPLQNQVSLILPIDVAGSLRRSPARMVVLLRCREGLELDYGIRFRDAAGRLHLPADGPGIAQQRDNGRPFQAVRDFEKERSQADSFVQNHRLDADAFAKWIGTIGRQSRTLTFIESVQRQATDPAVAASRRIEVLWDRSLDSPPVTVLGAITPANVQVEIESKQNWFRIGGRVEVDGREVPVEELLAGVLSQDGRESGDVGLEGDFVRLSGRLWARVDADLKVRLQRLRGTLDHSRGRYRFHATAAREMIELESTEVNVTGDRSWQTLRRRHLETSQLNPKVPENLRAELRPYQVEGYRWMCRLAHQGVGGILADDMGLGKTLQTLAVLLDRASHGPALVVAPTSVTLNWMREATRFAPDVTVHNYRETNRKSFLEQVGAGSLVVCSYGLAMRDASLLASVDWNTLVLDEAQAVKNANSKTSLAIASIPAAWTVALTGTPIENHLGELWSLFRVVAPEVFGPWERFRQHYAERIERDGDDGARHLLAQRIAPLVLRRTKAEVLSELPPRSEANLYVDLSIDERAHYEEARQTAIQEIASSGAARRNDDGSRDHDSHGSERVIGGEVISDGGGGERAGQRRDPRFQVLAAMTQLRQLACHVGLVDDGWQKSSAKLDRLSEVLGDLKAEGHRVLVFSQFTRHLSLIRERLDELAITYEYLDGSTPTVDRQRAVDRFQSGSADAFLISLKAGGTGLNLTAADYVIHMDPWWNPAVEDQATDRAHRMGQARPVIVYRMIARQTIEEQILSLHAAKRDLVTGVMAGTSSAAKLDTEQLMELIRTDPLG